ncbi:hypothetical protein BH23CHL3_BH23CHL3_04310 [soil metagenome]
MSDNTFTLAEETSIAGTSRFVRYAFMPNRLHYCGGDNNSVILDYAIEGVREPPLDIMLRKFTGAMPYLSLIARSNGITDPFDERVVEAYWLGNSLLSGVEVRQLHDALLERFSKQLQGRTRAWLLAKAPAGARPHHNFHVFDVHSRVGEIEHSLDTMDNCRISWGKVVGAEGSELVVERQPLILADGKIALGTTRRERSIRQVDGRGFADGATVGDWVSLHWGWVCEVLTPLQQRNLAHYTEDHLRIANQTV